MKVIDQIRQEYEQLRLMGIEPNVIYLGSNKIDELHKELAPILKYPCEKGIPKAGMVGTVMGPDYLFFGRTDG